MMNVFTIGGVENVGLFSTGNLDVPRKFVRVYVHWPTLECHVTSLPIALSYLYHKLSKLGGRYDYLKCCCTQGF